MFFNNLLCAGLDWFCMITHICQDVLDRKNIILQIKVWENESERRGEVEMVGADSSATMTKERKKKI